MVQMHDGRMIVWHAIKVRGVYRALIYTQPLGKIALLRAVRSKSVLAASCRSTAAET